MSGAYKNTIPEDKQFYDTVWRGHADLCVLNSDLSLLLQRQWKVGRID